MLANGVVDTDAEFLKVAGRYRVEFLADWYRLLGSARDAKYLVQETYLRAWRSFGSFEGRSSVRTGLYRIATNSCLTARAHAAAWPLPSGLCGPRRAGDEERLAPPDHTVAWLFEIPPIPTGFAGREAVSRFLGRRLTAPAGTWRVVVDTANTEPAVALYLRGDDHTWRAESLHLLTVTSLGISRIVAFRAPDTLAAFALAEVHGPVAESPAMTS